MTFGLVVIVAGEKLFPYGRVFGKVGCSVGEAGVDGPVAVRKTFEQRQIGVFVGG